MAFPTLRSFFARHDAILPREQGKFGGDPRIDGVWPAGRGADKRAVEWSLGRDGSVEDLCGGIEHLRMVLDDARNGEPVVLKFKREGCAACRSTEEAYASLARSYRGRCRFFTVDFNQRRDFCWQCGIQIVPCAHVWQDGDLREAVGLGPSKWDAFVDRLAAVVDPRHATARAMTPQTSEEFFSKLAEASSLHSMFG